MDDVVARGVIQRYAVAYQPMDWRPLGSAGGFSGACLWRIAASGGQFCLRCWPEEHPSRARLDSIHRILRGVADRGLPFIPVPIATLRHDTVVEERGRLWELTPWLPGAADYHQNPSRARLTAALQALARFHVASENLAPSAPGCAPSLIERRDLLTDLRVALAGRIAAAARGGEWSELAVRARRILARFSAAAPEIAQRLARAVETVVPLQPCIRDVWHDHVLFVGDHVTGIVDFGAMRGDSVACDIARLLGSLVGDAADEWQWGLAAYQQVRPLSVQERQLVRVADAANVLLSGMNWLKWVYLDQRVFADRGAVIARLDGILTRLDALATRPGQS